jgi:hypothetical protein
MPAYTRQNFLIDKPTHNIMNDIRVQSGMLMVTNKQQLHVTYLSLSLINRFGFAENVTVGILQVSLK